MVEVNEFNDVHQKIVDALEKKFDDTLVKLNEIFLHKKEFIFEKADQTFAAKYSLDAKGNLMIWDGVEINRREPTVSILGINSADKSNVSSVSTPPPDKPEPTRKKVPESPEVDSLPGWDEARPIQGHGSQISRPREHK